MGAERARSFANRGFGTWVSHSATQVPHPRGLASIHVHYLRSLRWIAAVEATSFLALLVATYLKYQDHGATGVHILGPIHGVLFLAYVYLALQVRADKQWDNAMTFRVLLGAVLPFGGYVVDWRLLRERRQT
jgi:hypothetical protein